MATVLIVDDDDGREVLRMFAGARGLVAIGEARDGQAAVELAARLRRTPSCCARTRPERVLGPDGPRHSCSVRIDTPAAAIRSERVAELVEAVRLVRSARR